MAAVTTIAIGVVFVLLLGEIDLSIGYVSRRRRRRRRPAPAPRRELADQGRRGDRDRRESPVAAIGFAQGWFVAIIGVPVLIRRHAGRAALLAGRAPPVIGDTGTVTIHDQTINNVANYYFRRQGRVSSSLSPAARCSRCRDHRPRPAARRHGITSDNWWSRVPRWSAFIAVVTFFAVHTANNGARLPGLRLLWSSWSFSEGEVAERTTFGRHVYAVGGSAEAARRAGINVPRIRIMRLHDLVGMAALGGVVLASRLASVTSLPPAARSCWTRSRPPSSAARASRGTRHRAQRAAGRPRDRERRQRHQPRRLPRWCSTW